MLDPLCSLLMHFFFFCLVFWNFYLELPFCWYWPFRFFVPLPLPFLWSDHGLLINNTSIHQSVSGLLCASQFNLNLTEKHDCNSSFPPEKNCHQGNQIRSTLFVYPELYAIRDQKSLFVKVKPQSNKKQHYVVLQSFQNHFRPLLISEGILYKNICTSRHPTKVTWSNTRANETIFVPSQFI